MTINDIYDSNGQPTDEGLAVLAEMVEGKPWAKAGRTRIYFATARGTTAYLNFDGGWELKIFIDDCGQHPNWYKSQKAKLMSELETSWQLAVGSQYAIEPASGYSDETNATFNAYAQRFVTEFADR